MTDTANLYEERCVLFLDILGFSDHIRNGREAEIYDALRIPDDPLTKVLFQTADNGLQVSAFSDSIVISNTMPADASVGGMIILANYVALKLLAKGMLSRGGMTIGKMHHKDGVLFGPAMLEAYEIEQHIAFYPRIVVSQSVIDSNDAFVGNSLFLRQASDGVYFIHILGSGAPYPIEFRPDGDYSPAEFKERALEVALQSLKIEPTNLRAAVKHDWFRSYVSETRNEELSPLGYRPFNEFIEKVGGPH